MRLRELDAHLVRYTGPLTRSIDRDDTLTPATADGLWFRCPTCQNHYILCWFVGKVPDDLDPKPGRWNPSGTGIDDLTFVPPGAVSVLLTSGCGAHFFIRDGAAV